MENEQKTIQEVLIVNEDPMSTKVLVKICQDLGFKCTTYVSPVSLLKELEQKTPFMIISDFKIPEMNGLKLCDEVRKVFPTILFIICTGSADKDMAKAGLSEGVTDIVEKPLVLAQARSIIGKVVKAKLEAIEADRAETDEIVSLFIDESTDLLTGAPELILRLEEVPIDIFVVDSLFRKIHSVKGGAGAVPGGKTLAKLAHEFESILSKIKKGEYTPPQKAINVFLVAADLCLLLVKNLRETISADVLKQVESTITTLKEIKEKGNSVVETAAPVVASTEKARSTEEAAAEDEGIWVSNEKLDSFMALSGELIVLKNNFQVLTREVDGTTDVQKLEKKHAEFAYSLNKITDHLQEHIMSVRKVSLEKAFGKLGRVVRQTSMDVKKKVRLKTEGLKLGVDKNIAQSLSSSLVHMVRNSIDHGIESREQRLAAGKSEEGSIFIKASESRGTIFLTVSDDGGGIHKERVLSKAIQNGLITADAAKRLSDPEIFDLIFLPGFSTAEAVTDLSGRGVGMDVVRSSVLAHGGRVHIESKTGQGAGFYIEIPVPKAVMVEQTLLGRWKNSVFAVPLTAVARISSCDGLHITEIEHTRMCQFEGQTIVLRSFDELLQDHDIEDEGSVRQKSVVVLRHKTTLVGLMVDNIEDQLEAVVRPFDNIVKSMPGFKGTAVLGNEQIAYVVSPEEMVNLLKGKTKEIPI